MKNIFIISLFILFSSCGNEQERKQSDEWVRNNWIKKHKQNVAIMEEDTTIYNDAYVYVFDGCQYVKFSSGLNIWGAHKGNCNNPIHKK